MIEAYQPELKSEEDTTGVTTFRPKKVIWSDDFGRCEIINHPVRVKRLARKDQGLHYYQALNDIDVYSFKFQDKRKILLGRNNFRAYARQRG